MTDRLRSHDIVLVDGSLVLRPLAEYDWETVASWNTDPRVLWLSEGDHVRERSIAEVQGIYRGVSQTADVILIEHGGVAVGDGWVQTMNLPRIMIAFPDQRLAANRPPARLRDVGPGFGDSGDQAPDRACLRPGGRLGVRRGHLRLQ